MTSLLGTNMCRRAALALVAVTLGPAPWGESSPPERLVPDAPLVFARVEHPAIYVGDSDAEPSGIGWLDALFSSISLELADVEGLDIDRPWYVFVTESVDAEPHVSALVALEDEDAFRRSLLGVDPLPGFDVEETYVLVGTLPLPSARGTLPSRQSSAPVEIQVAGSRLVESFGELFQEQALERETFVARWQAYLAGRDDEPLTDIPSLSERADLRDDLLFRALADTELAVLELTPSDSGLDFAIRLDLRKGSESAVFAELQMPAAPDGLNRVDAALPSRVWSNLRLPQTPELRAVLVGALSRIAGVDRRLLDEQAEGRRVLAVSSIFDTVHVESVAWPEIGTEVMRERLHALHESTKPSAEQPVRRVVERDVSELGDVPVDRLTTYILDPDTGASLEQIEHYFAWDSDAVHAVFSIGAASGFGFERLRHLMERDSGNDSRLEKLLSSAPDELVLLSLFDAAAWDEQVRRLVPEPIEPLRVGAEPALLLHATTSPKRIEIGGTVDLVQMALTAERGAEVARIAERYYTSGMERLEADGDAGKVEAAEWLAEAARLGNLDAHVKLADLYWSGRGVREDRQESFRRYAVAANRGHVGAQVAMGNIYFYGYERERDYEEALAWYRIAALQNAPLAQQKLGIAYAGGWGVERDHATAAQWFRAAAEQGDALSCHRLGELYEKGLGVERDLDAAERWYERAAESGHGPAFEAIGALYDSPSLKGVDYEKSTAWYRKGATVGHPGSKFKLAYALEWGQGTETNYEEAGALYREVSETDDFLSSYAMYRLGELANRGRLGEPDPVEAAQWYRKAAERDVAGAQRALGELYLTGRGVARDEASAMEWFRKAAEKNLSAAAARLGWGLVHGVGVEKDPEEGVRWLRLSAERGDSRGQTGLGESYEYGRGVEQDWSQAFLWYSRAADQGNDLAQMRLGVLYMSGNGVEKNLVESYRWLLIASRNAHFEPIRKQAEGLLPVVAKELTPEELEEAKRLAESFVPAWQR